MTRDVQISVKSVNGSFCLHFSRQAFLKDYINFINSCLLTLK